MLLCSDKLKATEDLPPEDQDHIRCAAYRGEIDVTQLRDKILSLPPQAWEESYNRRKNVALRRPFHDKLGVKKIICIFSDTSIDQVYYLPAWDEWKKDLVPIIESARIDVSKIVRLLFANLPAQATIPVHHDNGYVAGILQFY